MQLIKPAILVLALTVLVTSIGSMLLGWQLSSLTSSLCMLLLGLILLQAQNSGPGERSLPPSGVRLLGAVGVILSGLVLARGLYGPMSSCSSPCPRWACWATSWYAE